MTKKGQQVPVQQMLPNKFEPRQNHRFLVEFDGIDCFLVKKLDLPKMRMGGGILTSGLPAKLHLHCPANPATEEQVRDAMLKQGQNCLKDCVLKFLNPVGTVVQVWTFLDTKIQTVEFTPPCYDSNDLMECVVSFKFKGIKFGD